MDGGEVNGRKRNASEFELGKSDLRDTKRSTTGELTPRGDAGDDSIGNVPSDENLHTKTRKKKKPVLVEVKNHSMGEEMRRGRTSSTLP
ncbi:hypothetical protein F442_04126, partial [Phytophthora nicotianae P10297]